MVFLWVQAFELDERSLEELPTGAFDEEEIRHGGFLLYMVGITFLFFALREICESFFMPSIDYIIERYEIKPDIAAATIMAIGGSAPEIFISFFGFFLADSNIGLATILGSGALNGMLLVGISAMAAQSVLDLQWWQVMRDFFFNSILLAVLIALSYDYKITWWEGLVLFVLYLIYTIFMKFNAQIERFIKKHLNLPYEGDEFDYHPLPERPFPIRRYSLTELESYMPHTLNFKKGVLAKMMRNAHMQIPRNSEKNASLMNKFKKVVHIILRAIEERKRCERRFREKRGLVTVYDNDDEEIETREERPRIRKLQSIGDVETRFTVADVTPASLGTRIRKFLLLPFSLLLRITIPNVKRHKNLWLVTLIMSLVWIGFLTFLLVWWTLDVGRALYIPDSVLGMIVLAAGVSIPDLVNTLRVTLEGNGDMALSGSLGSNIMNLSFGLGLPLILYGAIYDGFTDLNDGIFYSEILLLSFIGVSYIFMAGFKWQLSKHLGGVMFFFYVCFIALFLVFEFR